MAIHSGLPIKDGHFPVRSVNVGAFLVHGGMTHGPRTAADIYSLGQLMYFILTSRRPYSGASCGGGGEAIFFFRWWFMVIFDVSLLYSCFMMIHDI